MKELTSLEKYDFLATAKENQVIGLVFPCVRGKNSFMGAARIKIITPFPNFKIEVEEADLEENLKFDGSHEKGADGIVDILERWMSTYLSVMPWGAWDTFIIVPM